MNVAINNKPARNSIDAITNDLPVFIITAYNRPKDLASLLSSFETVCFFNKVRPKLIVSIDGNNDEVINTANSYSHLIHEIIIHGDRLGLKNHILRCGDLTDKYDTIVMLEDDLVLSPNVFKYLVQTIPLAKSQVNVASISLYNFQYNDFAPFKNSLDEVNGDIYYVKSVSSWGQVWWKEKWDEFRTWLENEYNASEYYRLPERVKKWPDTSWKKLFNFWLTYKDYYSLVPKQSLALCTGGQTGTNMSGIIGVSFSNTRNILSSYNVSEIDGSTIFDSFLELDIRDNSMVLKDLNIRLSDVEFDLACAKNKKDIYKEYVLTRRFHKNNHLIASYDINLGNPLLSVMLGIRGEGLYLVRKEGFQENAEVKLTNTFIRLQLPWISSKRLLKCSFQVSFSAVFKSLASKLTKINQG
ncbi:hypothetical protein [Cobetia sp. AM6]|uniref:hypothetical protein n=1 Tax=Cobetia sp. AM6 TaxID=2661553 RepID=UPI001298F39A|nr:hypothetical protein [Cobetia sp. AM6]